MSLVTGSGSPPEADTFKTLEMTPLGQFISSEEDRAPIVPCPAKGAGCVAQDLDGAAARINALQLGRLEETHLTTIR